MTALLERDQWGARPPRSVSTIRTPSARLILHHGASPGEGPSRVRSYQRYHMDARGYVDIAYSWLADSLYCYVGRGAGVAGAHTGGHNDQHAVCAVGDYSAIDPPDGLLDNLAWMAVHAWKVGAVDHPSFDGGHRDYGTTSCPGHRLYIRLDEINRRAARLAKGNVVTLAQAVVVPAQEAHLWDRPLGAAIAQGYGLALVDSDEAGNLTHEGRPAEITDWAEVVGGGTRYPASPDAHRIAGGDRWATARAVFDFIRTHPPEEWARRGRPYP